MKSALRVIVRRKRPFDLALDALFGLLLLHVMLTGRLLPTEITDLLHHDTRVAAVQPHQPAPSPIIDIVPDET